MSQIGMVGLGLLGGALADRLLAAGHAVVGYDLDEQKAAAFVAAGGAEAGSVAEVGKQCDVIVLSLPDSNVVRQVLDELGETLRAGQRIIDTSTGAPNDAVAAYDRLKSTGVAYLDATILGSSQLVRERQAVLIVGGENQDVAASRDLLTCFGREVFHVGPAGSGAKMKLVVNLALGLHRAVLAEALALARTFELDLPRTLEVLKSGAAYSKVMDLKGAKMLTGEFSPQARLSQHLKDVRLMLSSASDAGRGLPLCQTHLQLLERAVALGYGEADNSAIVRVYEQ